MTFPTFGTFDVLVEFGEEGHGRLFARRGEGGEFALCVRGGEWGVEVVGEGGEEKARGKKGEESKESQRPGRRNSLDPKSGRRARRHLQSPNPA